MGSICSIVALEDKLEAEARAIRLDILSRRAELATIYTGVDSNAKAAQALVDVQKLQTALPDAPPQIDPVSYVEVASKTCSSCSGSVAKSVAYSIARVNADIDAEWNTLKAIYNNGVLFLNAFEELRIQQEKDDQDLGNTAMLTLDAVLQDLATFPGWTKYSLPIQLLVTVDGYVDPHQADAKFQLRTLGLPDPATLIVLTNNLVQLYATTTVSLSPPAKMKV